MAHDRSLLADTLVPPHRAEPHPQQHGVHYGGGDRLPERERTIVAMRFFDELSQSEIAEQVGVSQMHVSRLLRSSFERMRAWADDPAEA